MSNPFARIASAAANASVSPHWEAVKTFQEVIPPMPRYMVWRGSEAATVSAEAVTHEEPLTVWMRRGHEGSRFTYLVTDGQVKKDDEAFTRRIVTGGTFVLEIIEIRVEIREVTVRLRPGFDPEKIISLLKQVDSIRWNLRHISKSASDEERTIEMVIHVVD